ncbi:MAG: DUF748 domain-containing protein [Verrucomicrobia bacterium]|nr:DUF748 domain-containing protein [Verrucomicrobiota bacterium]
MKRKRHWYRWPFYIGLFLLILLVIVRALLPFWVRDYVNRKLSEMPDYRGHVAEVTLHIWRGAYQIHGVDIEKTTGHVPVPFFSAPVIDLSVQWRALFDGALVGEIDFYHPQMNFVNAPSKANSQVGIDKPWTQTIKQLFPLKINRFGVHNGEIHYRDFSKKPPVDVVMDRVQMVATNLTNSKKLSKSLVAEIQMQGRLMQSGEYKSQIALDPYAAKPTFTYRGELEDLPLVKLNEFAKAYASITFEKGTLRVASELTSTDGAFKGYVEPVFDHMAIFSPEHDSDNPVDFVWQGIVGGLTRILRNQPKDRFGTKVPLSGNFDNPKPAIMTTILNVFRNAFIQAFTGTLQEQKRQNIPDVNPNKSD